MTQYEKDLLLKDLCARLPYGVKVRYSSYEKFITCTLQAIDYVYNNVDLWSKDACFNPVNISKIKPYLFPLSCMTKEQKEELDKYLDMDSKSLIDGYKNGLKCAHPYFNVQDWYNKNHFDYRCLISMGLAIDATGLNIY